jgi:hypothetical protein
VTKEQVVQFNLAPFPLKRKEGLEKRCAVKTSLRIDVSVTLASSLAHYF